MRNRVKALSVVLASATLLIAASAQAQCAMWCPYGSGPAEFATIQRAQAGCGGDQIVWAQDKPRVYHKAGWPKYGKTPGGSFICQASTQRVGLRQANLFQRFF